MVDIIEEGQKLLEARLNAGGSGLTVWDIKHIIYLTMKDAHVDHNELFNLRRLDKFSEKYMTPEAQNFLAAVVGVLTGEIKPKGPERELYNEAKQILKAKGMGKDSKFDLDDIKELIFRVFEDGVMSRYELDEMEKIRRYTYSNMTPDAAQAYEEFMEGFKKKVESFEQEQMRRYRASNREISNEEYDQHINTNIKGGYIRKVHDMAPETYRQCGTCYGSGRTTCSSCGGMGGHYSSRVSYDYDGNPVYSDEFIPCGCSGGYTICGGCGGSGSVYA